MDKVGRRQPVAVALTLALALVLFASTLVACGGDDQPDLAAFCEKLGVAFGPEGALASDYSDDPGAATAVVEELESLRQVAPLEIEPSLAVINETVGLVVAAFGDSEGTGLGALQEMEDEITAYGEAAGELARFSSSQCALELDWERPVIVLDADRITGEVQLDVAG